MAIGTEFKGSSLDHTKIRSYKYALLCCNVSDFTRGTLFEDGSTLYVMGLTKGVNVKYDPDLTENSGVCDTTISRKAELTAEVLTSTNQKALQELEDSRIVVFVVDVNKLIGLSGFTYDETDFSSINGICNSEYTFYNVIPQISYESQGGSVNKFDIRLNVNNKSDLSAQVYENEPVGTFISYWDWTASNSLDDSVSSITLTAEGSPTYSTDHYIVDGTSQGIVLSNFSATHILTPSDKEIYCILLDSAVNSVTSDRQQISITDGSNAEIIIKNRATQGYEIQIFDNDNNGLSEAASYNFDQTSRTSVLVYINLTKKVIKFLTSTGEATRESAFSSGIADTLGGFSGGNNDLFIAKVNSGLAGNLDIYKLGISS